MASRRIDGVGAGLAALLAGLCVLGGCATGSDDSIPDGDLVGLDGSVAHDGHAGDGGISFSDGTFPGVDGSGHGDDATEADDSGTGDDATPADDSGSPGDDTGSPGVDGGTDSSTTCPPGMTGPGCADCATGFHLCGATCTADETNDPSVGCSQSCGSGPCATMGTEVASCSAAGACTYACPSGTLSCGGGTCAACCASTDCSGSTPDCVGGTCQAPSCNAPSGECSGVCTDLTTNQNCGSCGTDCPDSTECIVSTIAGFPFGCDCTDEGGGDYECD